MTKNLNIKKWVVSEFNLTAAKQNSLSKTVTAGKKFYMPVVGLMLLASVVQAASARKAFDKIQVCSMTFSSDDEKNIFREVMGDEDFEYRELIPEQQGKKNWLADVCRQTDSRPCDIKIVSGHYGGEFSTGWDNPEKVVTYKMHADAMQMMSCDQKCHGIMSDLVEVYLLGCNTLAGRGYHSRNDTVQAQALRSHGYNPEQTNQFVAQLYSNIGFSPKETMSSIYSGVENIYGFGDKAPSGFTISKYWRQYWIAQKRSGYVDKIRLLKKMKKMNLTSAQYSKRQQMLVQSAAVWNQEMQETYRNYVSGLNINYNVKQNTCQLIGEHLSLVEKLEILNKLWQSGDPMSYILMANKILLPLDFSKLSKQENDLIESIRTNQKLKKAVFNTFNSDKEIDTVVFSLLSLSQKLGWLDANDVRARKLSRLVKLFSDNQKTVDPVLIKWLAPFDLKASELPNVEKLFRKNPSEMSASMYYLKTSDPGMLRLMFGQLQNVDLSTLQDFADIGTSDSLAIDILVDAYQILMLNASGISNETVRAGQVLLILSQSQYDEQELKQRTKMSWEKNLEIDPRSIYRIAAVFPNDVNLRQMLLARLGYDVYPDLKFLRSKTLASLPEIVDMIKYKYDGLNPRQQDDYRELYRRANVKVQGLEFLEKE